MFPIKFISLNDNKSSALPRKLVKNVNVIIIVLFFINKNSVILPGHHNIHMLDYLALVCKRIYIYSRKEKYLLNLRNIMTDTG